MAKKFKVVVSEEVYSVAEDGTEKLQTEESYTWHGVDVAQRHVIENCLNKHMDGARAELNDAGLVNAIAKGDITPEEVNQIKAFAADDTNLLGGAPKGRGR
jgi:hypothetical protein